MQKSKICGKCKEEKLATTEYFGRSKDVFQSWCKECKKKNYLQNKKERNNRNKENYRKSNPIVKRIFSSDGWVPVEQTIDGYKKCCVCQEIHPKTNIFFNNSNDTKDGFKHSCKRCRSKEYVKNKEYNIQKSKKYYEDNKNHVSVRNKAYKEKRYEFYETYAKKYYKENKEHIKENVKKNHYARIEYDVGYKLLTRYRKRLWEALKGRCKPKRTQELIGCTIDELKIHLEKKFKNGMTWDNYGKWHVDHIRPCSSFDFGKEHDILNCFNYSNLQPLWANENLKKSNKYKETL